METLAIDWSGRKGASDQRRHIWTAVARDGELLALSNGSTRQEVVRHLVAKAERGTAFVVGLDFAFSFPAWFVRTLGVESVYELWAYAEKHGGEWLTLCQPPFWGRPGKRRPPSPTPFRRTELECERVGGIGPKSVFQVNGLGSVGTGSILGMPFLLDLHNAGFSIWPFDAPGWPKVVEIYPRVLTGPVRKTDWAARRQYLRSRDLPPTLRRLAEDSDDAFDAAISSLVMARHVDWLSLLGPSTDPVIGLEGQIWTPSTPLRAPQAFAPWSGEPPGDVPAGLWVEM